LNYLYGKKWPSAVSASATHIQAIVSAVSLQRLFRIHRKISFLCYTRINYRMF
jgi:hypothetical protein